MAQRSPDRQAVRAQPSGATASGKDVLDDDYKDIWSVAAHATIPEDAYEYHAREDALVHTMVYKPYSSLMPVVRPGVDTLPAEEAKWAWVRK